MLTQWHPLPIPTSTMEPSLSHMSTPVHSHWLPGYIDVAQTILYITVMAGLFLDRPHKYILSHGDILTLSVQSLAFSTLALNVILAKVFCVCCCSLLRKLEHSFLSSEVVFILFYLFIYF